ncbi:VanZ family protein [Nocardiopsis gilva]|uniref:VanZ family protein n=1 Tax=Nocardiopsis gilva TaxID=280236 RepID=UPI0003804841|nr:VanZ family protein [Nocardiopsis gilva]
MAAIVFPGVALGILLGAALFFARHHQRYGPMRGWPGQVTLITVLVGVGLAVYAVYPLPRGVDGLCAISGGSAPLFTPLAVVRSAPVSWPAAAHIALAAGVYVPVGLLARYRYRRGAVVTVAFGLLLALLVEVVQLTGVLGLYPCAYRVAAVDDVVLGGLGVLVGWLVGIAAVRWLPRPWPGATADMMPPPISRRVLGHGLDLGLWWFGAGTLAALAVAVGALPRHAGAAATDVALVALAALFGLALPLLRRDRCTPGRASVHLALAGLGRPRPAERWRVLLRSALLYTPVTVLFVLDLQWWALAVPALHGLPAMTRRDQTGLFDLIAGARVVTRGAVSGGLPRKLVRYSAPRAQDGAHTHPPTIPE